MKLIVPERGRAWELLNSRWLFATVISLGIVSFMTFFYIGSKVKNKTWKIWGVVYGIALFGLGFNDILDKVFIGIILSSIIHAFVIRHKYLIALDAIESN